MLRVKPFPEALWLQVVGPAQARGCLALEARWCEEDQPLLESA